MPCAIRGYKRQRARTSLDSVQLILSLLHSTWLRVQQNYVRAFGERDLYSSHVLTNRRLTILVKFTYSLWMRKMRLGRSTFGAGWQTAAVLCQPVILVLNLWKPSLDLPQTGTLSFFLWFCSLRIHGNLYFYFYMLNVLAWSGMLNSYLHWAHEYTFLETRHISAGNVYSLTAILCKYYSIIPACLLPKFLSLIQIPLEMLA